MTHNKLLPTFSKKLIYAVAFMFILATVLGSLGSAANASPSTRVYLAPASASLTSGGNVSFNVQLDTGGENVNAVSVVLNYDQSKLQYVSLDSAGSAFGITAEQSGGGGNVTYAAGNFAPVNTASAQIVRVTFKTLTSGSSTVNIDASQTDVRSSDTNQNVLGTVAGAAVSATGTTDPPPPDPDPQPNPTTPPKDTPSGSSGSGNSNSGSNSGSSNTNSDDLTPSSESTNTRTSSSAPVISGVEIKNLGYKDATVVWKTDKSANSVLSLGTEPNGLGVEIKSAGSTQNHAVNIGAKYLEPGTTYYVKVSSTDGTGEKSTSSVYSFVTKGYDVKATIVDQNNKPIAGIEVTLNSDTRVATTDDNGNAIFNRVAPGSHTITFEYGGESYSQSIEVEDTLGLTSKNVAFNRPAGDAQAFVIPVQSSGFSFDFGSTYLLLILLPLLLVGGVFVMRQYANRMKFQKTHFPEPIKDTGEKTALDKVEGVKTATGTQPGSTIRPTNPDKSSDDD